MLVKTAGPCVDTSETDLGTAPLVRISLELRVDTAGLGIRGSTVTTIARLRPGGSASFSWTMCALEPGNYVVLARATMAGGVAVDSVARLVSVSGVRRGGCARFARRHLRRGHAGAD